jgi:hypothetical protein
MPKLICKNVLFFSMGDEASFFYWVKNIKCIKEIVGIGDEMQLIVSTERISDDCLRDLIAIFYRYNIDMEQLTQFTNDNNVDWFKNSKMFWYEKIWKS